MRSYKGVKSRLAIEFTGWSKDSKSFLYAYRGKEPVQKHRYYNAKDIRNIRLDLVGRPPEVKRMRNLPPIMNFRMSKGGTGKTTTSTNVAACIASLGYRVLLIDGDPESAASETFGIDWTMQDITHIGELMRRANKKPALPTEIRSAVIPIYGDGMLDLIASDITMAGADSWLSQMQFQREKAFVNLLEKEIDFFSEYDVIIIDSAPATSILTTTFMVASRTLLAVVLPERKSRRALPVLESNIQELNEIYPGENYNFHIVVNKYNQTKKPHMEEMGRLVERYSAHLSEIIVRDFVGFLRETDEDDAESAGPILEREPNSVGARDIIDLSKSLIKFYNIKLAEQGPV